MRCLLVLPILALFLTACGQRDALAPERAAVAARGRQGPRPPQPDSLIIVLPIDPVEPIEYEPVDAAQ